MKILHIIPSVSLVYGGPSQMVVGLAQAQAALGHQVTIVTTDSNGDRGQAPLNVPLGVAVPQTGGYEILYFRCSPFKRYKFSTSLFQWLWSHGKTYDIAHIHALFSPVSSIAATIARTLGLPYVLRPLGTLDPADLTKKRRAKQLYAAILEKPNLQGAAAIHFTSDQEAKVSERFGTHTQDWILPLGVMLPERSQSPEAVRSHYQLPSDRPVLLFMSRIEPKKGLDLLIPALESLAKEMPFHLVMAGANPQEPEYEAMIRDRFQTSILGDRTTFTGFVTGSLKTDLLHCADVFVLPSYYENFGIAVAEAMAVEVPVVISDQVHIHTDITRSNSGWVCECDVESLKKSLKDALQNPDQRRIRGANGLAFSREVYSWAAIAPQVIAKYQSVLG
jgi:glycosyltransferase involved in cell wall biosynthesis